MMNDRAGHEALPEWRTAPRRYGGTVFLKMVMVAAACVTILMVAPEANAEDPLFHPSDIDANGAVNAVDVQLVINGALSLETDFDTDVNRDGVTNAVDVQLVINAALGIFTIGSSIAITPDEAVLGATGSMYLEAESSNPADSIEWVSMNPSVLTVDQAGAVRAVAPGTAQVCAVGSDSRSVASAPVMVVADTLTVRPSPIVMHAAAVEALAVSSSASNDEFSFASENTAIAAVNAAGEVTGVSAGETVVVISSAATGLSVGLPVAVLPADAILPGPGRAIVSVTEVQDEFEPMIIAELDDGEQFALQDVDRVIRFNEDLEELSDLWPIDEEAFFDGESKDLASVPTTRPWRRYVNHYFHQTPIRNQRDRNTCTMFAAVAALEARYRRAGYGSLDLSEQQFNHLSKMTALHPFIDEDGNPEPRPRGVYENQHGMASGGGSYNLIHFTRYGIPLESVAPYRHSTEMFGSSWGDYHNLRQDDDYPRIPPGATRQDLTQREINIFNLEHNETTWQIPRPYRFTPLSNESLRDGQYGITGYHLMPQNRVRDLAWWENVLDMGYEIVFDAILVYTVEDGVWVPGSTADGLRSRGAHSMVMVGYDRRDPNNSHFFVKNSWGESQFLKLDYAWVTARLDGTVLPFAAVITGVTDPAERRFKPQAALGRWTIQSDLHLEPTDLEIFRLAQFKSSRSLGGVGDWRLGEFYDPFGDPFKVNGTILSNRMIWFLDLADHSPIFDQLSGNRFVGYFDSLNPVLMAGHMLPPGGGAPRGFYGHKDGPIDSVSPYGAVDSDNVFKGRWEIIHHQVEGWIEINDVNLSQDFISCVYENPEGARVSFLGRANYTAREIDIPLDNALIAAKGAFDGHILETRPGILAGRFAPNAGDHNGMVLRRVNYADVSIAINQPTQGASITLGQSFPLSALTAGDEAVVTEPAEVRWSIGAPFDQGGTPVASGRNTSWTPTGTGTFNLFAVYREPSIAGAPKRAEAQVTVTVNSPQAPQVAITSPPDGTRYDQGFENPFPVTFTGQAVDPIDGNLPGGSLSWSYRQQGSPTWISVGTGSSKVIPLEDFSCTQDTVYEIRLQATNSLGVAGTDIITVRIDVLFCR